MKQLRKQIKIVSIVSLFAAAIGGCKSYSKFTIDDHPSVKIDSGLLGMWKAVEDTDKANFILVQSSYDILHHADVWRKMDSAEIHKIIYDGTRDTAAAKMMLEGALETKEAFYYESYDKFIAENNSCYYITYFNAHGKNALYQQWKSFLSKVGNATLLNIPYSYVPTDIRGNYLSAAAEEGFFFLKLLRINSTFDTIATAFIADTGLISANSSKEVRSRITKNINNRAFYGDTVHFYKVNGYHLDLNEAVKKAN